MRKHIVASALAMMGFIPANAKEATLADTLAPEEVSSSSATGLLLGRLVGDTALDRTWSAFTLYKDDLNPVLQEFSLQGRLHLQGADGHADNGGHFDVSDRNNDEGTWGDDVDIRRARLGFKSKWFNNYKLDGQIDIDPNLQPDIYHGIYDLYVSYAPSDTFNFSVGKTKVKFGREQETSSNNILTFERTLLANMLFPGELTGAWVNGKGIAGGWLYELGIYSNERDQEFADFNAGEIILAKVGYDYSEAAGIESGVVALHYMHNTEPNYTGDHTSVASSSKLKSPNFNDSFALTNEISEGRFGLMTEAYLAMGEGTQSDVAGITIMPTYFIADGLQLVTRFQYATSDDINDLSLPSRYEGLAPDMGDKKGDEYMSAYLGLNYYIHGHKLKLMSGLEYASMNGNTKGGDYDGYTWMNGVRLSF